MLFAATVQAVRQFRYGRQRTCSTFQMLQKIVMRRSHRSYVIPAITTTGTKITHKFEVALKPLQPLQVRRTHTFSRKQISFGSKHWKYSKMHQLQSNLSTRTRNVPTVCCVASVSHFNHYTRNFCNSNTNNSKTNTNQTRSTKNEPDLMKGLHSTHRMREREKIGDIIEGNVPNLQTVKHPHITQDIERSHDIYDVNDDFNEHYTLPHPIWSNSQTHGIEIIHTRPTRLADYLAYGCVQILRITWDLTTGYLIGHKLRLFKFSYKMWLLRLVYLETVAGVPGMMFGMVRHLNSLRRMERDHGWIHTLLAEAENERMHLLTFLKLYEPSKAFRYCVVSAQFIMSNFLFICYLISPRFCHKFVGYLEEEAVKTYTGLLEDIEAGKLPEFNEKASKIARGYWQLNKNATWKDVILQIRADEAHHRDVNHTLAPLSQKQGSTNPFRNES